MLKNNNLYKWLIVTFVILYSATAFVSFYHSITFFNIANIAWLSVILSLVCEIGQASVLFSLLLTKNKNNWLAWSIMFLLTGLQIVGNVVSSFKYISISNSIDFTYFQKSILFWVSDTNTEMFKIIIAWITGGILPIIALSMTALVADNLKLKDEEIKIEDDVEKEISSQLPSENLEDEITTDNVVESNISDLNETSNIASVEKSKKVSKPRVAKGKRKKADIKGKNISLKPIKDLDSIKKISRGSELIQTMQSEANKNDKDTHINYIKNDLTSSESQTEPIESPPNISNVISTTYDKNGKVIDQNYR